MRIWMQIPKSIPDSQLHNPTDAKTPQQSYHLTTVIQHKTRRWHSQTAIYQPHPPTDTPILRSAIPHLTPHHLRNITLPPNLQHKATVTIHIHPTTPVKIPLLPTAPLPCPQHHLQNIHSLNLQKKQHRPSTRIITCQSLIPHAHLRNPPTHQ